MNFTTVVWLQQCDSKSKSKSLYLVNLFSVSLKQCFSVIRQERYLHCMIVSKNHCIGHVHNYDKSTILECDHVLYSVCQKQDERQKVINVWYQTEREAGKNAGGEGRSSYTIKVVMQKSFVINSPGPGSCSTCSAAACSAGQYLSGCGGASPGSCVSCPSGSYSASGVHASMRRRWNSY
jgi:hypothetical protein